MKTTKGEGKVVKVSKRTITMRILYPSQSYGVDAGACVILSSGATESLGHVVEPPRVNSEGLLYLKYGLGAPCGTTDRHKSTVILFECDDDAGLVWYWHRPHG